jgi:hypothetical protein
MTTRLVQMVSPDAIERGQPVAAVTYEPTDGRIYIGGAHTVEMKLAALKRFATSRDTRLALDVGKETRETLAAQVTTTADVEAIKLEKFLGLLIVDIEQLRTLRGCVTPFPTEELESKGGTTSKISVHEKVAELEEIELGAPTFEKLSFKLYKNRCGFLIAEEAFLQLVKEEVVIASQVPQLKEALADAENRHIAEVMETATTISGSDWGDDSNNPYDDLGAAMDAIETPETSRRVQFVAANPRGWLDFFGNSHVKGTSQDTRMPEDASFPIPGLPGVRGYSDRSITATVAVVGTKQGVVLVDGPVQAAKFEVYSRDAVGYLATQWLQPKLVLDDGIRVLTGIHA